MKTRQSSPRLRKAGTMLLALIILAGVFTGVAPEARAVEPHVDIRALTYQVKDGKVTITDCVENATGTLEIPATLDGCPVTVIGSGAFSGCSMITGITLPNSVTSIESYAFSSCSNLSSINIPSTVTSIGKSAFIDCTSLTRITLPGGVTKVADYTFSGCSGLESVTLPDSITEIGESAFKKCASLKEISLPKALVSIGLYAFSDCTSLRSVVIPNSVTAIGSFAFERCSSLVSVQLSSKLTALRMYAFYYCTSLTEIIIPDSVTSIGDDAFAGCSSLKKVTISGGVKDLKCTSLFSGCTALETVVINEGMESIEGSTITGLWDVFEGCVNVKTLYLPSSLYNISAGTFSDCVNIQDIYYAGTAYAWGGVAKDPKAAAAMDNATMHYVPFKDTKAGDYFYIPMTWAIDRGVTNGTSETTFSPGATCTQGQIITFLYRAVGEPQVSGGSPYANSAVTADQYYYKALLWAYQQGVVTDVNLDPNGACKRSDVVTYLWRLNGKPTAGSAGFTDVPASAAYAQAVAWAIQKGITTGTSSTTFSPDATCTRAQIVTFLYRAEN